MTATHSDEFKRDVVRIALTSGLTRRQVGSDLGVGLSTLGKWIRAISEEGRVLKGMLIFFARMNGCAKKTGYFGI